jgi:hypothetical protein
MDGKRAPPFLGGLEEVWKELELDTKLHWHQVLSLNEVACSKVLQKNAEARIAQGEFWR